MRARRECCCINPGCCLMLNRNRNQRSAKYYKLIKFSVFFVISVFLALIVSNVCDRFSMKKSMKTLNTDLLNVKYGLNLLSMKVKNTMAMHEDMEYKLDKYNSMISKSIDRINQMKNQILKELNVERLKNKIKNELKSDLEMYNNDETNGIDYALETFGGEILTIRKTENYPTEVSVFSILGLSICPPKNTPNLIIQSKRVLPGDCWAFKGNRGCVVIKLFNKILLSSISIEHVSLNILPNKKSTSAPRDFSVLGLENIDDNNGFLFGKFTYNNSGNPLQNFSINNLSNKSFEIIEIKFHSNNGNPEYTCIYRIRIYGNLM